MKRYSSEEIRKTIMEKAKKHPDAEFLSMGFAILMITASIWLCFGMLYFVISRLFNCDELWKRQMANVISFGSVSFAYYRLRMRLYEIIDYVIFWGMRRLP